MSNEIIVYHDTDVLAFAQGINKLLKVHGLEIVDDGKEHDGYCVFTLKGENAQDKLDNIKAMIEDAEDWDVLLDVAKVVGAKVS